MKIGRKIFFSITLILLFLFSCSVRNRQEGAIYFRLNSNPTTLDPGLIVDVSGAGIAAKLFNGLVRLDHKLQIVPDIAERWTVSEDGKTYTFHIRKGVTFSNGREVTAQDFKYSFERILSPRFKSPNTWVLDKIDGAEDFLKGRAEDVKGIEVEGKYILKLKLKEPFSPFLGLLTMTAAYVIPEEEASRPDFATNPVGTGPFILKRWSHNNELVLERREDYFEGPAYVKKIIYRIIPEDLTAITEFELSNIDVLSLPASALKKYTKHDEKKNWLISHTGLNIYYLGINCSKAPLDNPLIRKAIAHAIDRERILKTIYEERGVLADGIVPPGLRQWSAPQTINYEPERARELIKISGYNGEPLVFYVTQDQEVIDIAEVIQEYLRKAGLNVKIRQLEWSAYKEALIKGEEHLFWLSWWADYPDPENFLFPLFHSSNRGAKGNRTMYRNPEVDKLIEIGQRTVDIKRRPALYERAEELIMNDLPLIPFWHKKDFYIIQPWIEGFNIVPVYSIDKGMNYRLRTERLKLS
ncbi:MAG: ABC transporter substrate-binding protein [Thermodesulfovibrionales bacterium]|nr:ABC transporter substrate-binding protein [Thermodesulfovibrionales bacterium]